MNNDARKAYPSILGGSVLVILMILVGGILTSASFLIEPFVGRELSFAGMYFIAIICNLLIALSVNKSKNGEKLNFKFKKVNILVILVLIVLTFALQIGVSSPLISLIPISDSYLKTLNEMNSLIGPYTLFCLVLVVPIIEEIIFRGIILRGFITKYSNTVAIVASSILFAFFHLNPWQFISAFLIGCISGWIYLRSRNLLLCMIVHAVNNAIAFSFGAFFGNDYFKRNIINLYGGKMQFTLIVAIGISILVFSLLFLNRKLNNVN
jgi:membrane protease YdiL (CAAX protease family)